MKAPASNGSGASEPVLVIRGLTVTYPHGTTGLDGIDLELRAGSCLAVIGESGSGKSTLIGSILGLLPRRARLDGSIRVDGTEIVEATERERQTIRRSRLGYVPQDPFAAVDPLRPVVHHLRFAARAAGRRLDDSEATARLAALGLDPEIFASRPWPHQWSGGMLQRACIAAATIAEPMLVLADEPTSALDPEVAEIVLSELRSQSETLLIVTHDLDAAALIADEVAVLHRGTLVEHGPASRVLNEPQHPYTTALLAADPARRRPEAFE